MSQDNQPTPHIDSTTPTGFRHAVFSNSEALELTVTSNSEPELPANRTRRFLLKALTRTRLTSRTDINSSRSQVKHEPAQNLGRQKRGFFNSVFFKDHRKDSEGLSAGEHNSNPSAAEPHEAIGSLEVINSI